MAKYQPGEKLNKVILELQKEFTTRIDKVKIDNQKDCQIYLDKFWRESFSNKVSELIRLIEKAFAAPSNRMVHKMRGIDMKEAYENLKIAKDSGVISFNSLQICLYLFELSTERMEFVNLEYLDLLIDIIDPISDHINQQELLVNEREKEIKEAIMAEYNAKVKELQDADVLEWQKTNPNKKGLKSV